MTDVLIKLINDLAPDKRALLSELLRPKAEPVAVVGIGCRFPGGANSPDAFWRFLESGGDAVTEVPADRWDVNEYYHPDPARPGKTSTRWGAFIREPAQFDAAFFGISPREAYGWIHSSECCWRWRGKRWRMRARRLTTIWQPHWCIAGVATNDYARLFADLICA